jgi:membrane-associated phospholipid phosphatase
MENNYNNLYSFWVIILTLIYSIYIAFQNKYILIIGIFITWLIHYIIKYIIKIIPNTPNYFIRPKSAKDCNILNNNGTCDDQPGFPSGHVATTSFFFNYLLLKYISNNNNINKLFYFILFNIPVLLMGVSRYYKKCHNILQIIGGYVLGVIISIIMIFIEKKYNL